MAELPARGGAAVHARQLTAAAVISASHRVHSIGRRSPLLLTALILLACGCAPRPRVIDSELGPDHPLYGELIEKTVIITSDNVAAVRLVGASGGTEFTVDESGPTRAMSAGRGCLISSDGLILTAAHNLTQLPRFKIFVCDHGVYRACGGTVVSIGDADDLACDYAFIRAVGVSGHASFAIDRSAAVGTKVLKYGFGFASGVISDRAETASSITASCAVAAEHGESGGPVVDYRGRLVGISSRIAGFSGDLEIVLPAHLPDE